MNRVGSERYGELRDIVCILDMWPAGIPIGVFQSMFAIIAMDTFKLAPDENGFLMSYVGVLTMVRLNGIF